MEKTIAAIATPPGEGGIGIIRISGDESLKILNDIFHASSGKVIDESDVRHMIYGNIVDDEKNIIDEAMVVYMKAPHSYTGENVVEIQCHGSIISLRKILDLIIDKGAFLAERGEFTKRAFFNGRIDLSQAEAVIDIIKAKSNNALSTAVSQLGGALSKSISDIRYNMANLISDMIARIEYPEEDLEELDYSHIISRIDEIYGELFKLYDSSDTGRIIKDGLRVSILGRPNVGKSSLLNLILNEDRAIVTDIPGTTRDTIQEYATIGGIPVILTDTAGIRETEDIIERIGIEKSFNAAASADLVILMIDASDEVTEEDIDLIHGMNFENSLILLNKSDIADDDSMDKAYYQILDHFDGDASDIIRISASTGEGKELLTEAVKQMVYHGKAVPEHGTLVTNVRHSSLMKQALENLNDAREMLKMGEALDFAETDIRVAWQLLGEITGESVSDDIISEVFSRFCLGK